MHSFGLTGTLIGVTDQVAPESWVVPKAKLGFSSPLSCVMSTHPVVGVRKKTVRAPSGQAISFQCLPLSLVQNPPDKPTLELKRWDCITCAVPAKGRNIRRSIGTTVRLALGFM